MHVEYNNNSFGIIIFACNRKSALFCVSYFVLFYYFFSSRGRRKAEKSTKLRQNIPFEMFMRSLVGDNVKIVNVNRISNLIKNEANNKMNKKNDATGVKIEKQNKMCSTNMRSWSVWFPVDILLSSLTA